MKRLPMVLGIILLVLGAIGLVHPSFNYHQQEEVAKIGPVKATVDEQKTAQVPASVSITLLAVGIVLVVISSRAKQYISPFTLPASFPLAPAAKFNDYRYAAPARQTR